MTEVVAGWYPDPAGSASSRWWDGTRWTESTMAPNSTSNQQPGWTQPSQQAGWPPTQTGTFQQAPYGQTPSAQVPYQQAPYGQAQYGQTSYNQQLPYSGGPVSAGSLWQSNRYTVITVAVAIVYALLGLATHVVLIGIVPILFAVRAFRAREKLAVLAAVIAGLSVVLTIILVSSR
jgi:uncharacterized protein DUF2510